MIFGALSENTFLQNSRHDIAYQQMRQQLAQELNLMPQQLSEESNLIQQGLDSMRMMRWLHWFRQHGYSITLRELYANPTLAQWRELMHRHLKETQDDETATKAPVWQLMTDGTPSHLPQCSTPI